MFVRFGQVLNAYPVVFARGIVRLVSPEYWNAKPPIIWTLSGIVMLVRSKQSENAKFPMFVTLFGIDKLVIPQEKNAKVSMLVTPTGMVRLVSLEQLENAPRPIFVMPVGTV